MGRLMTPGSDLVSVREVVSASSNGGRGFTAASDPYANLSLQTMIREQTASRGVPGSRGGDFSKTMRH